MSRVTTTRLRFIEPQLASPVDLPPEGKHWIHEVKHDGYRTLLVIEDGEVRVYTRNGFDWTDRYPSIVRSVSMRCRRLFNRAPTASFFAPSTSSISTARISASKLS
jgi:ATP-dependent DNA ligase